MEYTINGFFRGHVTVLAEVVPVRLELSPEELEVRTAGSAAGAEAAGAAGLPAEAGMRAIISLTNPLNSSAEFTWAPILGDRGTAFSVRPATGV